MANDPLVVQVMREFKADLAAREADQMGEMAKRWMQSENELGNAIDALALEIDALRQAGEDIPVSKLMNMDRYKSLVGQTKGEYSKYSRYADGAISGKQAEWGKLGLESAVQGINASYMQSGMVVASFDRLPVDAIERMIGMAGDGSPLKDLLAASYPDAVDGITNALINAVTMGKNPRDTARDIRDGYGVGLDRALNIARTEQLRAFRLAAMEQYRASGLVGGYKRLAAKQMNTCMACLLADGTMYDLETDFEEHPSGRCTLVPVVNGLPEVGWPTGMDWFTELSEEDQLAMMGSGAYDAWSEGLIDLVDLVTRQDNDTWGASLVVTPLSELLK